MTTILDIAKKDFETGTEYQVELITKEGSKNGKPSPCLEVWERARGTRTILGRVFQIDMEEALYHASKNGAEEVLIGKRGKDDEAFSEGKIVLEGGAPAKLTLALKVTSSPTPEVKEAAYPW
ncbi:hypothetical protein [Hahella sp. NBU794]|uniref:hypothetical protein n=1 Tax=Hahella sp. NBU794 TaxID=3422590 RepID=UPI003D6FCE22